MSCPYCLRDEDGEHRDWCYARKMDKLLIESIKHQAARVLAKMYLNTEYGPISSVDTDSLYYSDYIGNRIQL